MKPEVTRINAVAALYSKYFHRGIWPLHPRNEQELIAMGKHILFRIRYIWHTTQEPVSGVSVFMRFIYSRIVQMCEQR